jgi:hypothetical protein
MNTSFYAAFLAASCWIGVAWANQTSQPSLANIKGMVLLSTTEGFAAAYSGQHLRLGDRVLVTPGSTAVLYFGPDCALPLGSDSIFVVEALECTSGTHDTGPQPTSNDTNPMGTKAAVTAIGVVPPIVFGAGLLFEDVDPVSP